MWFGHRRLFSVAVGGVTEQRLALHAGRPPDAPPDHLDANRPGPHDTGATKVRDLTDQGERRVVSRGAIQRTRRAFIDPRTASPEI